jgi:chromosome segregation ATPase
MLENVKLIVAGVLGVVLFGGGYSFGARKVDSLEAQIEELKKTGDDAEAKRKNTQAEIDKALKDREAEHAKAIEALKVESSRREKDLGDALAGANTRNAELQSRLKANDAQRARLQAAMATASEPRRRELEGKLQVLKAEDSRIVAQVDANKCLGLAVPDTVIGPLVK